ncbi:MAG: type 4a pilus biogenesis protein PilO [Patescibacteria group bacterium]
MKTKQEELKNTLLDFYKNPVAQVSTELFFTIAAVMFFALFAIRPTLVTMSDLVNELEEKRKLNTRLSQKIAALSSLQGQYSNWSQRAVVLNHAFPSSPELIKILKVIEKLASDNELAISDIKISQLPDNNDTDTDFQSLGRLSYPISITVLGDYSSIRQFIEDIQNMRRVLSADTITFNTKESANKRQLSATIILTAHYFGEDNK